MSQKKRDQLKMLKLMGFGAITGVGLSILFFFVNRVTINFDFLIEYSLYIQIAVVIIFFLPTVYWIQSAKKIINMRDETIDVDDDLHSEALERLLYKGLLFNRLYLILNFLSAGLAFDFSNRYFIISILVFLVTILPGSMNEVKIIRLIQAKDPMKQGDPTSIKFNKTYFESLDESEKNQVYQVTYHTFKFMEYTFIVAFGLTLALKMYFDMGNAPMLTVSLMWLIQSIVYFYYSKKYSKFQTFV